MSTNKILYKKLSLGELVIFAQQDDFRALEELLRREQGHIYASFCYLSGDKESVSDLTQETLLKIAKSIKTLKQPNTFKSWENHIVINVFYDTLRKKRRHPDTVSIDDESDEGYNITQIPDKKSKPPEKIITSELEKIIKAAILTLPEPFRIAIILRELQGLSYEEIARATNATVGTVKSRIARARGRLQNDLKAYI